MSERAPNQQYLDYPFYSEVVGVFPSDVIGVAHRGGGVLDPIKSLASGEVDMLSTLGRDIYNLMEGIAPQREVTEEEFRLLQDASDNISTMVAKFGVRRTVQVLQQQNTLEAFSYAGTKLQYVEADCIASRADGSEDSEVFVFHGSGAIDNPLVRVIGRQLVGGRDGEGLPSRTKLSAMTASEIRNNHPASMTVDELMDINPKIKAYIDPKLENAATELAAVINRGRYQDRISIGSFSDSRTQLAAELVNGRVATSLGMRGVLALTYPNMPGARKFLDTSQATSLQIPESRATTEVLERAAERGLVVITWSSKDLDGPDYIRRSIKRGDGGFMTNYVDDAVRILRERNSVGTRTLVRS